MHQGVGRIPCTQIITTRTFLADRSDWIDQVQVRTGNNRLPLHRNDSIRKISRGPPGDELECLIRPVVINNIELETIACFGSITNDWTDQDKAVRITTLVNTTVVIASDDIVRNRHTRHEFIFIDLAQVPY